MRLPTSQGLVVFNQKHLFQLSYFNTFLAWGKFRKNCVALALESDGTVIDDGDVLKALEKEVLILLEQHEQRKPVNSHGTNNNLPSPSTSSSTITCDPYSMTQEEVRPLINEDALVPLREDNNWTHMEKFPCPMDSVKLNHIKWASERTKKYRGFKHNCKYLYRCYKRNNCFPWRQRLQNKCQKDCRQVR